MGQSHTAYEDCEWGRTQIPRPNSLFVLPCMLIIKLTSASESLWSLRWWPWSCSVPLSLLQALKCVSAEWGVGSSWGPVSWWKGLEKTVLPLPGPSLWPPRKETAEEAKWLDSTSETWKCEGITLSFRLPSLLAACKIAMLITATQEALPNPPVRTPLPHHSFSLTLASYMALTRTVQCYSPCASSRPVHSLSTF